MKKSHADVLKWLAAGAYIWAPSGSCRGATRMAWVNMETGHPADGRRVRVRTLQEMEALGLVQNMHGIENAGEEFGDNIWVIPKKS